MTELTLEQSLKQILPTLPLPIQKFFEQRKLGETAHILMERYALHVDQGAILERELMLLLLGLENPEQFAEALYAELPISKQTVQDIIADVNAQIFVPLREEMRKGPNTEVKPPQAQSAAASAPPREVVLQPRTTIIPANPNLPLRPAQMFASVPRYIPPKKYFNLQNKIPHPQSFPVPSPQPPASRLLEDHEEPHIDISEKVQVVSPPTIQRKVYEPPPNLPGAIQPLPIPEPPPPPLPPKPKPAVPSVPYSADPYREPV